MITVKKLVYSLVLAMVCSFCISSCDKNAEDMSYLDSRESRSLTSEVITRAPSDYDAKLYEVDDAYKNAYQHYLQEKSACGRTSYVLAVAAIVRGKGNLDYPRNSNYLAKIHHVAEKTNSSTAMSDIDQYCKNFDAKKYPIASWHRTAGGTDRAAAIEMILDHRTYNSTPFLYLGSMIGVTTRKLIRHYYIIWDVKWTGDASSSTVWCTNVGRSPVGNDRSYDANVEKKSLKDLLDGNLNTNFNFLFLY
jgi:hypothetical protein